MNCKLIVSGCLGQFSKQVAFAEFFKKPGEVERISISNKIIINRVLSRLSACPQVRGKSLRRVERHWIARRSRSQRQVQPVASQTRARLPCEPLQPFAGAVATHHVHKYIAKSLVRHLSCCYSAAGFWGGFSDISRRWVSPTANELLLTQRIERFMPD